MVFRDIGIDNTALAVYAHTTLVDHIPVLEAEIKKLDPLYEIEKILTWKDRTALLGEEKGEL